MLEVINKILQKENIKVGTIEKSSSGFTNQVYFINDDLVLKLTNNDVVKQKLNKEISVYNNVKLNNIPKMIGFGDVDGYKYVLLSKVKGKTLYSVWHTLTIDERESVVKQIAEILKQFNKCSGDFLNDEFKDLNWADAWKSKLIEKQEILKGLGFNVEQLNKFITNNLEVVFNNNTYGLVYNDAHFDNFLIDCGKVYLIDFDRVRFCPTDYEMMIFKCMCDNPLKFASEEDELTINPDDYKNIYGQLKIYYSSLFEHEFSSVRIYVYIFEYLMGQAIKINDVNWISTLLNDFNEYFKNKF